MEEKIRHLIKVRREEGLDENGFRDLYCLIVYCAYLSSGTADEIAWAKTIGLNESFQRPLPEKELRSYMSSATEKKYRFTFEKVIEYLDIDEKEQETICLKPAGVRKKEREMAKKQAEENRKRRKEEKEKKKLRVLELLMKGYTQQKIAGIIGCTQSTVSKVIKNLNQMQKAEENNQNLPKSSARQYIQKRGKTKAKVHKEMEHLLRQIQSFVPQWTS
ncbi:MAG: helix-turn-helix domain-containing protein [Anaerobutyricum sp.]